MAARSTDGRATRKRESSAKRLHHAPFTAAVRPAALAASRKLVPSSLSRGRTLAQRSSRRIAAVPRMPQSGGVVRRDMFALRRCASNAHSYCARGRRRRRVAGMFCAGDAAHVVPLRRLVTRTKTRLARSGPSRFTCDMSVTIAACEESRIRFSRLRPQLRLRTLLGAVAVLCMLIASPANRIHREQRAIQALTAHGVNVVVASSAPDWLPNALDGVWFEYVVAVNTDTGRRATARPATIGRRSRSTPIRKIELFFILPGQCPRSRRARPQGVPAELLPTIAALRDCKVLLLGHLPIGDVELARLKKLSRLQHLDLSHTQISDRAVGDLAQMRSLAGLNLRGTRVSQAGLDRLRRALSECQISR